MTFPRVCRDLLILPPSCVGGKTIHMQQTAAPGTRRSVEYIEYDIYQKYASALKGATAVIRMFITFNGFL